MKKSLITLATLAGGFAIGASALVAFATGSTWAPPTAVPTGGNVAAPINVGVSGVSAIQEKFDSFQIDGSLGVVGNLIMGGLASTSQLRVGPVSTAGQVLTAVDGQGTVGWRTPTGGGGGTCSETPTTLTGAHVYQNTTGTKLLVVAYDSGDAVWGLIGQTSGSLSYVADSGISNASPNSQSGTYGSITFVVPPNYYYEVVSTSNASVVSAAAAWQICESGGNNYAWQTIEIGATAGNCLSCPVGWTSYTCTTEIFDNNVSGYANSCYKAF